MIKKYLFCLVLLLTIGFSSLNTVLDLNGKVNMSLLESDLNIVFKEVLLNNQKSVNVTVLENKKTFIYDASELNTANTTSTLDFVIMNQSHQYDAEVMLSCTTDYGDYINYNGTFANQELPLNSRILIKAGEIKSGNILTELIKENNTEESLVLTCTLDYLPMSREDVVKAEEYVVSFDTGYEENIGEIKVKYYEEYGKLPELTRDNYSFLGWYTEDDVKVSDNSLVKIKRNHTLKAKWSALCPYEIGQDWIFEFTGSEQDFEVPCSGNYKIELWGAMLGGYTKGNILLEEKKELFIYVGGLPTGASGGYNGGGNAGKSPKGNGFAGGGATDVRLKDGVWNDSVSLRSRIMVAAGGAYNTGYAGGISGYNAEDSNTPSYNIYQGKAGTQISGGAVGSKHSCATSNATAGGFGRGGNGGNNDYRDSTNRGGGGGGGSGYYGGSGSSGLCNGNWNGGGGSSFISGHAGCIAIQSETNQSPKVSTYSKIENSYHYSGKIFTETVMIDGAGYNWTTTKGSLVGIPSYDGESTMPNNTGNGYAKITLLSFREK